MDILSSEFVNSPDDIWSIVWQTFENASLTYDLASSGNNGTNINSFDENNIFDNPTKLGIITGLLIAWLAEIRIIPIKYDHSTRIIIKNFITIGINIISFVLLSPIIASIFVCLFIYRRIIHVILIITMGKKYIGLLEGTDCLWAIEDSSALSIINALATLEISDNISILNSKEINIIDDLRNLIKNRLISSEYEKLFWIKDKKYGYYYWRKSDCVNLEERVRLYDDDNDNDNYDYDNDDENCDSVSKRYLKRKIARVCNKPLPQNHTILWEILIIKKCPKTKVHNCTLNKMIPLLIRVHHSVGDGVALLRLLLEVIADKKNIYHSENQGQLSLLNNPGIINNINYKMNSKHVKIPLLRKCSSVYGNYRESSDIIYYSDDLLSASMPFSKIIFIQRLFKNIIKKLCKYQRILSAFIQMPSCIFYQALRSRDSSALHGPKLTGNKLISYWIEDDCKNVGDYSLLGKIRDIKSVTGTRFGDVILAALSAKLNNYLLQSGKKSPKSLTVVIPTRMTQSSKKLSMNNRFSVGLLTLCVSEINGECDNYLLDNSSKIFDRLRNISLSTNKLMSDPDCLINYWTIKWLCAALPEYFLHKLLQSSSTMVFSNLPGPQTVKILGHTLRKIAFWIPHRGTTGIGFSFLSYGGHVNFSVTADKAIIDNENALNDILNGTIYNIEQLHEKLMNPCFK